MQRKHLILIGAAGIGAWLYLRRSQASAGSASTTAAPFSTSGGSGASWGLPSALGGGTGTAAPAPAPAPTSAPVVADPAAAGTDPLWQRVYNAARMGSNGSASPAKAAMYADMAMPLSKADADAAAAEWRAYTQGQGTFNVNTARNRKWYLGLSAFGGPK